jgi:hypothetical protein
LGKKAVASHTASLARDFQVFSAAFRPSGLAGGQGYEHMVNLAGAMYRQPLTDRIACASSLFVVGVGSFIVVLQAEILESYLEALRSVNYTRKSIIACVTGKEFCHA